MQTNEDFVMSKNYIYPRALLNLCLLDKIPFVYASSASVYGNAQKENNPLNLYAFSKNAFDNYAYEHISKNKKRKVIGLRFFNVYGKNEYHKGRMASFLFQKYCEYKKYGNMKIFKPGDQQRDFIWVEEVIDVLMKSMFTKINSGIYDVGTGVPTSFYEISKLIFDHFGDYYREPELIDFPKELEGKYQHFTAAKMDYDLFNMHPYKNIKNNMKVVLQQYETDLGNGRFFI